MELVVFDLDGTLLNAESEISPFTRETLGLLSANNIAYTVATGRNYKSAQYALGGEKFKLPLIYSNGVMTYCSNTQELLLGSVLSQQDVSMVTNIAMARGVVPFVTTVKPDLSHCVYHPPVSHLAEQKSLQHLQLFTKVETKPLHTLRDDQTVVEIYMSNEAELIKDLSYILEALPQLMVYSGPANRVDNTYWMHVHHCDATKGAAVSSLGNKFGFEKVICFGDSDNDLSLFAVSDEAYAPENAKREVKEAATAVIGHHDQDGIAHFLRERFQL